MYHIESDEIPHEEQAHVFSIEPLLNPLCEFGFDQARQVVLALGKALCQTVC